MEQKKGSNRALVLLCLLAVITAASGCGSSTETMPKATGVVLSAATSTAGVSSCAVCHPQEADGWLTSRHANAEAGLDSQGTPTLGFYGHPPDECNRCHDPLGDSSALFSSLGTTARPVIGCESCHGPGSLHVDAGGAGPISLLSNTTGTTFGAESVSAQFRMCTACHMLLDDNGALVSNPQHSPKTERMITDTHFATVPVTFNTPTTITGYAMDFTSPTVCADCHNPHGTADINRDWAASGHGDMTAGPWSHYNWSESGRAFCQRCHTTTGFKNYANANAAGDATTISNIWNGLVSNFTTTYWKPEMLECTGCHTNNRGALRNPGAYNATYGFRVGSDIFAYASYQYPDASSSNVCVLCHSGRNSGETIHLLNSAQAGTVAYVAFNATRASTAHDMTAAGTVFRGLGYEYAGRNYENPASYRHDQIGTAAVPNTGTGGPCVGCHMYRTGDAANHLLTNVNTFVSLVSGTTTTITVVSSEVCFNCHAGSSTSLGAIVEEEKEAFTEAVSALYTQLEFKGFVSGNTNWLSPGDIDTTGNRTGKNNMGAYFNRSYLNNEPGAFVHNSKYTKRLIYDSIDWIDDNKMNYSVGQTLEAICSEPTASTWCPTGMPYILPNGVRPGAAAERPN